ncbi:nicotinate (nicotinamide) nucleotide adenylyltransferase [Hydromonas duriensis]|uniref:Probable nicotinate-nucleotide adenylyltransferase n=1 Tax=Hydromonas duriensis TaxID=1527608 RepID=A0A4R6Y5W8_9BURK|nr:nicotinate (nicotinamide) nucleotide adenylyltransferase [Hydromonas duriensis]TDR30912.1 nicotinate-nucleotide adenylyltransferase [Hydromonas duriensis]
MKLPIGCFGGTFNPPHTAHFALLHSAREQLGLAQVLLIPAGQPWQKPHVLATEHRLHMLQLAMAYDENVWQAKNAQAYPLQLDTLEVNLPQASYTVDTLRTLRERYPDTPLVWIMGSDQLSNLHTWHNWQELLDYAHIAVAQRAGHEVLSTELPEPLQSFYAARVTRDAHVWHSQLQGCFVPFTLAAMHISSSAIRQAIAQGQAPQDIAALRPAVADYIQQQHLYGNSP